MAESTGKIYITISDERKGGPGNTPVTPNDGGENINEDKLSLLSKYAQHRFFDFIKSESMKAANFAISEIGNLTGDYAAQREIQSAMSGITSIVGTVMAGVGAAKAGGLVGLSIFALTLEANTLGQVAQYYYQSNREYRKNLYEIKQVQKRTGANIYYDGGRGTED